MKKIVLLGAPGAGKGTMAKMLSQQEGIPQVATGDLFRAHMSKETALGKRAKEYVENGSLVPDEVVVEMVKERLKDSDAQEGFILDGFPRTVGQAEALDVLLKELDADEPVKVFNLDATDEKIVWRLTGRRICSDCGDIYNLTNRPPKVEGICNECGAAVVQRKDDNEETIQRRLNVYRKETAPLIEYYQKQDALENLPGDVEIAELRPIVEKLLS